MLSHSRRWLSAACVMLALAACDDDPNEPTERLALVGCPASADVNAPLTLEFTTSLNPATVAAGSIIVSSAATGLEIPGAISLVPGADNRVAFTPSSPFRFAERVRVRVQNLRSAATNSAIDVQVCEFTTPNPPITQLYWRELPNAGGNLLTAVALVGANRGYVMANSGILSELADTTSDFVIRYQEPRFFAGFDVDFVSPARGFATFSEFRRGRSVLVETRNGGASFDSVASVIGDNLTRIVFDTTSTRTGANIPFNAMGGGGTFETSFYRYLPATRTFRQQFFFFDTDDPNASGQVQDLDLHPTDTARVAAVTAGISSPPFEVRGWLWYTTNGGAAWQRLAGTRASDTTLTYWGVAVRSTGETWITGGNGFIGRVANPFAGGTQAITRVNVSAPFTEIRSIDPDDPSALVYTDVQFAPDNPQKGWIIGAQLLGQEGGVPRYQGLIFETSNGGQTWTRQGVLGAANYGAEIPRLNRLEVRSSSSVWIVGDGGTVLRYVGSGAPGDEGSVIP